MAEILKPTNLSLTWASGGDILDPGDSKYASGWTVEIPPRQWFNYLDNRQDEAIAHINQHGVAAWDAITEYQEDKSYTQGSTNGTIYRCVQTHTNQDPELDLSNTYWIIAFASAGDFYTKTETDGLYLAKAQNLFDLPNLATARSNLSVYAIADVYNKTEVDGKTTVASIAQSQAWASNTTLITPLRLSDAFKGANQSLVTNGFQKIPGGFIIQWCSATVSNGGTVNFPTTFPNAVLSIQVEHGFSATAAVSTAVGAATTSNFVLYQDTGLSQGFRVIAIGW